MKCLCKGFELSVNLDNVTKCLLTEYFSDSYKVTNPIMSLSKVSKIKTGFWSYVTELKEKIEDLLLISDFNFLIKQNEIDNMLSNNQEIRRILRSHGIKQQINLLNIMDIYNIHCLHVFKVSKKICKEMNLSSRLTRIVKKSALFHDFGKILIPVEILQKPAKLSVQEKKIVDLHAQLGYEMLKTVGFENQVLEIIKNHHNLNCDVAPFNYLVQIVSVSDIYSALTSARSYKKAYTNKEAFEIMNDMCKSNKLDGNIVSALKNSLK